MTGNGAPPEAAAALYAGKVMHHRMRPKVHRFTYDVFSLLVDLDRLNEADRMSRLFGVNRRALVSFFEADHLETGTTGLRAQVDRQLADHGVARPARILLVSYPRMFGFVFNPLSVYYAYDAAGRLTGLIYEVRNTFGGRHSYVCPVTDGEVSPAGVSQSADKLFHVSPFLEMEMRYHFRMLPPGRSVRWRILETDDEGPKLAATFSGEERPLSSRALAGLIARMPLMTAKVMVMIHWQALKLWLKGVPFFGMTPHYSKPRPAAEEAIADSEKTINLRDMAA